MMSMPNDNRIRIAVIGGGAAGLFSAGIALSQGADVTIYEHMAKLGRKLLITGKGRCNLTNNCTREEFLSSVITNPRFLYSALNAFSTEDCITFFENLGLPLKTERGKRVFPVSDQAGDVLRVLETYAKGAHIVHRHVDKLLVEDGRIVGLHADKDAYFDKVILATGGASYPLTGSDGSGHKLARDVGHTIVPLVPSLVPLVSPDPICQEMMGLSLKNVAITVKELQGKTYYQDFGEMLFTHFGVSGPMILSASTHLRQADFSRLVLEIDLKPSLDEKTLDKRLLSDFASGANRDLINIMGGLLPKKMCLPFVLRCGIDPQKKVHDISKEERRILLTTLKHFTIPVSGFRPLKEAIVTAGGVSVNEIFPKTMESRLISGLYFAGEIMDVDAYTGGFSLQIAFSTAYLAGLSASQ